MTVDLLSMFTGTVHGKTGSLVIRLIGDKPSPEEGWGGDWEIIRGTGELKNLQGQGTWGGPGYEGPRPPDPNWDPVGEGNTRPDIWYKGTISTAAKVDVEADIAAIKEGGNQYAAALSTGDLERWLSLHTDDIVKMGPGAPSVIGLEHLREKMVPRFENSTFKMTISSEETEVAGDWGFDRGTYTVVITPKKEGEPIFVDGKYLTIYKKQADGSWKISHDCYNSNVP